MRSEAVSPKQNKSKKRRITAQDLYDFRNISNVRISPDGNHVVYAEQRVDRKTEKKFTNLWVVEVAEGLPRQFTFGDQTDAAPNWSPDGSQIAFLSNRKDQDAPAGLFLIPLLGGEARPLSAIKGAIVDYKWSPNGKKILCAVRKLDPEQVERLENEQQKKLGVVSRHYDRLFYKLDGYGYRPHERLHLWTIDVASGKAHQITNHRVYDEFSPVWSPDSRRIAFISNHEHDPDQHPDRDDIYVMPAKGGEAERIDTPLGSKEALAFSPDGKWIAYFGRDGEGHWYRNHNLWVVPVDSSTPAKNLLANTDFHVDSSVLNDLIGHEPMPPVWSNDGAFLYFPVLKHGSSLVMRVDVNTGELSTIIDEGGAVVSFSFDQSQENLVYQYGRMMDPSQIFIHNLTKSDGKDRQLTHQNQDLLGQIDLGKIEEIWFKGPDGNDLQGWILKPPGFDPKKKYPSIMEIHGGPLGQYGNQFMHEFYFLAAQGYVVYFCNPRGGRGYGEKHAGAIWGGWGDADYRDLMAWADFVESKPYIDRKRMGVTGGSYGGYMTVWIIGHTDRFKAAVAQRCVSNFVSMWGSSDMNWVFQEILGDQAPFENLEKFWKHSPIAYIGNARTPTLVIHSENDLRCPIEQGEQVFVALQRLGVDSEFVRFPDEFHGLSRTGRTDRRVVRLNHMKRWFDRYLETKPRK
jgi:dipeptidyl aminopeptidase/acylaminoacyl peptidase